ncbi:ATP-binding protein [Hymenobacter sp. B1770]|uniref:sensor histidine kinase n=1 Tax=Hymenobacter sp. B1770 TaxID=1718788 RepID=UPI003CEC510F
MTDFADFFVDQAAASSHVQFIYDVAADRVTFVNEAYEKVLHGRCEHVNEELPALLARLHPDDRAYLTQYCKLWLRGQVADEVEVRLQEPGQPDQWFCLTPHHQSANGRVCVGGTLRDISVAKRYQQNADNFNSRKNAALEILSHDLSGAFGVVQQVAQYLSEEVTVPANSRVGDMLRVLENTSRNSMKMIRDLVNIEFLASANTDLKRDRVEVAEVLRALLEELQEGQRILGQVFEYSLPTEPLYAYLDVNKITQVLTNLVSNAIKFTPDGKRVVVRVEACPGSVRLQVIDEGIGVPAALQPQLFERFTKARRPGLRGEQTNGLGLALCKTIVEWHGGNITVDSAEGIGSTFTVEIPQATAEATAH